MRNRLGPAISKLYAFQGTQGRESHCSLCSGCKPAEALSYLHWLMCKSLAELPHRLHCSDNVAKNSFQCLGDLALHMRVCAYADACDVTECPLLPAKVTLSETFHLLQNKAASRM